MCRFQAFKRETHTVPDVLGNSRPELFTCFPQDIDCDVLPLSFHIIKPTLISISDIQCRDKLKISSDNLKKFNNHTVHNTDGHGSLLSCIPTLNSVCEEITTTPSLRNIIGGGGGGGGGGGSGGGGGGGGSCYCSCSCKFFFYFYQHH